MDKVKSELEKAIRQVANFDKLKNHIEMTVTPEGLRIELLESKNGTFFDSGKLDPNGNGRELLMTIAEELGKVAQQDLGRGTHRFAALFGRRELHELGAVGRPRQCQPPHHAAAWAARGSGGAGARLCRSAAAERERSVRPGQSQNHRFWCSIGEGADGETAQRRRSIAAEKKP